MAVFSDLISQYSVGVFGIAGLVSILFWILFIMRYFSSQTERRGWVKFWDIVFMFFYIGLFVSYLLAGIYVGENMFGSLPIGVCIGIGAFWLMFEMLAFFKKKRKKF